MTATLHRRPAPQTPRPPRPPGPERVTTVRFPDLKPDGCRWALCGPPFRFCNATNDGRSRYCAAHHAAAARGGGQGNKAMSDKTALEEFLEKRDAVLRNPTEEAAREWRDLNGPGPPDFPVVPLATVHRARLQWLDATDAMLAESVAWLQARGYDTTERIRPPLTPAERDRQRALQGKPPLAETPP